MHNDFATNIAILDFDNSSSSYINNWKNNFLVLGGGPTYGINGSTVAEEKEILLTLVKANTKFPLRLH